MLINWLRRWRHRRNNKRHQWMHDGREAHQKGATPDENPHKMGSQAYIWWRCGWTVSYIQEQPNE